VKRLAPPDEAWNKEMKALLTQFKGSNQGLISELMAARRDGRPLHTYNGLKYASFSEICIARELGQRNILFFPLPVAVRGETGLRWQNQREVAFLICHNGAWGILEVEWHRYEMDLDKDLWFNKSGILCIEHYTDEHCRKTPDQVVDQFLGVLKQYERR
jgi:hypothetical protein